MSTTTNGSKSRRGRRRPLWTLKSRKSEYARYSLIRKQREASAEFDAMTFPAQSIEVQVAVDDPDALDGSRVEDVRFNCGDDVVFNSERDDTPDAWLGRISQIRMNADMTEVLVKVRWYYSRTDVAEHIKSFDITQYSPYERLMSDTYDFLSPETLQAVAHVREYDDSVLDPPQLGPTDFFVRTNLQFGRKIIKPPLGENTCLCQIPYNPFPELWTSPTASFSSSLTSDEDSVMHFCPRLGCRKWYHPSCLTTMGHVDTTSPSWTRGLQLLAVDPHSEIPYVTFAYFSEQESIEDVSMTDKLDVFSALELLGHSSTAIAHLPQSLLSIAQAPIVRCSGAPDGWAIGNVADVVLARRFVYAAVEHAGDPQATEAFRALLHVQEGLDASRGIDDDWFCFDTHPAVVQLEDLSEGLIGFELLASVYVPYWERRWRQFVEMQSVIQGPAFKCPQCASAI